MTAAVCPDTDTLTALLENESSQGLAEYSDHVETCPHCQQTLAELAGDSRWVEAARYLTPLQPGALAKAPHPEPALDRIMAQLKSELPTLMAEACEEAPGLSILRAPDRAGLLGYLGDYEVLEVIGRGGMGVVFKAFDPSLRRLVAVKVMAAAVANRTLARLRFKREAQAAAAVCHEHIVTVHGVHEADGLPYLVMQYVAGESLQTRLDRGGPLELVEIVRIGLQTASGLAAAHAQGLIHRDIKPANLLLENGLARVRITDFGLARMADNVQLTQNGVLAGTPEYMAPEQARGEPIDHRADLFSLGSVLHAMCTGVPPFRGANTVAVLRQVSDEVPVPVRQRNPNIPAWMEALVARLLAKNPADRFQSAAEVAALLEGYLAHLREPATIPAPKLPPPPREDRLGLQRTWFRGGAVTWLTRPLLFGGLMLAALGLVALGVAIGQRWLGPAGPAAGKGTSGIARLLGAAKEGSPSQLDPNLFRQDFRGRKIDHQFLTWSHPESSEQIKEEAEGLHISLPAKPDKPQAAGVVPRFRVRGDCEITVSYEILSMRQPTKGYGVGASLHIVTDTLTSEAVLVGRFFRPGGPFYVCQRRTTSAAGQRRYPTKTFSTNVLSGKLRLVRRGTVITCLAAENGQDEFRTLHQFDLGSEDIVSVRVGAEASFSDVPVEVRILDFEIRSLQIVKRALLEVQTASPPDAPRKNGGKTWLVMAEIIGLAITLSLLAGSGVLVYRRQNRVEKTATAVDGKQPGLEAAAPFSLPCPSCRKNLRIKPELAGKRVKCPQCSKPMPVPIKPALPPTGVTINRSLSKKWLLCSIPLILLIGLVGWLLWPGETPARSFLNVTLGSDFVSGIDESGFYYQETDRLNRSFRWTDGHAKLVIPIDPTKPPQALLVQLQSFRPPKVSHATLQVMVNKSELFNGKIPLGRWDNTFDLSGIDLGKEAVVEIISDTFLPKGVMDGGANDDPRALGVQVFGVKPLAPIEGLDGWVNAGEGDSGPARHIWQGHPTGVSCGAITPDGKTLMSASWDGTVKVWDVAANVERKSWPGLAANAQAVAISPDGATFAFTTNRTVYICRMETIEPRLVLVGHTGQVTALAYSPDGRTLASAAGDRHKPGELKLWNTTTGTQRVATEPFQLRLWGVAWSPDSKSVAVAVGDKTAQIVHADTGKVATIFVQAAYVRRVAFSPDGALLAVAHGDNGTVRIHEVDGGKERSICQAPAGRAVMGLDFSRDGNRLLVPYGDGTTILWDITKPEARLLTTLKGHEGKACFAIFFPDGQTVATGGDDKTIRLWNIATVEPLPDATVDVAPSTGEKRWLIGGGLALVIAVSLSVGGWFSIRQLRRVRKTDKRARVSDKDARAKAPADV